MRREVEDLPCFAVVWPRYLASTVVWDESDASSPSCAIDGDPGPRGQKGVSSAETFRDLSQQRPSGHESCYRNPS